MTNVLVLPMPPSSNRYWRIFRGHVVTSQEARDYIGTVADKARRQGFKVLLGPIRLEIHVYTKYNRDLSNNIKVLEDALQNVLLKNDSQVTEIHAYKHVDKVKPRVEVLCTVAEI